MPHMITAECINCTLCYDSCPTMAISPGASQFEINPNVCDDCETMHGGPRCALVCPVGACVPQRESYLVRIETMVHRGAPPIRYAPEQDRPDYVQVGWYEEWQEGRSDPREHDVGLAAT